MRIPAPKVTWQDLNEAGQYFSYQKLQEIPGNKVVRYLIRLDSSYPVQTRASVETWTPNGWTEVWRVDSAGLEKCGARPDHKEATVRVINEMIASLAWHAERVLA